MQTQPMLFAGETIARVRVVRTSALSHDMQRELRQGSVASVKPDRVPKVSKPGSLPWAAGAAIVVVALKLHELLRTAGGWESVLMTIPGGC